eukprot:TRINITY_DN19211_c0_g3_i2.p1 TRINITY_DN19211_c0_g3~~TRINITY_DN19211_c0_g3_i2.p1  ORF type:complete len:1136 (+),score=305.31 TRINITY_DN19211_c0_g3_i2:110-3409(+)
MAPTFVAGELPPVGARAEAHSLVNQSQLNGKQGTVQSHQSVADGQGGTTMAAVVGFDTGPMALKPNNLAPVFSVGEEVELRGMANQTAPEGPGPAVAIDGLTVREGEGMDSALSPEQSATRGSLVQVLEIRGRRALVTYGPQARRGWVSVNSATGELLLGTPQAVNGQKGTITGAQDGNYTVQLPPPHGVMAVRGVNLKLASGGAAPAAPPPAAPRTAADLPVGTEVEAHSLVQMQSLNGAKGKVTQHRTAPDGTQQIVVQFGPPHGMMALRLQNLRKPGDAAAAAPAAPAPAPAPPVAAPAAAPAASPESPPAALSASSFPVGARVEAHGLVSMKNLNGAQGKVHSHRKAADGSDQVVVAFDPPNQMMALRPANLRLIGASAAAPPTPPAATPQPAPALPTPATVGLPTAPAPAPAPVPWAAAPAPAPASPSAGIPGGYSVGQMVVAQGLRNQQHLNGKRGTVLEGRRMPDGTEQVVVNFGPPHGTMALRPINLVSAIATSSLGAGVPASTGTTLAEVMLRMTQVEIPPLARVILEGFLEKKTNAAGRDYDTRWYVLRKNYLIYYEEKGRLYLSEDSKCYATEDTKFTLKTKKSEAGKTSSSLKEYHLKAQRAETKQRWVDALKAAAAGRPNFQDPAFREIQALQVAGRACVEAAYWEELPRMPAGGPPPPADPIAAAISGGAQLQAATQRANLLQQRVAQLEAQAAAGGSSAASVAAAAAEISRLQQQLAAAEQRAFAAEARASASGVSTGDLAGASAQAEQRAAGLQLRVSELEQQLRLAQQGAMLGSTVTSLPAAPAAPGELAAAQQQKQAAEARAAELQQRVQQLEVIVQQRVGGDLDHRDRDAVFQETRERARILELERRCADLQRQMAEREAGTEAALRALREQSTANRLRAEQAEQALSSAQSRAVAAASEQSRLQSQVSILETQLSQAGQDLEALRRQLASGLQDAGKLAVTEGDREAWRRRAEAAEYRAAELTQRVGQMEHEVARASLSPPPTVAPFLVAPPSSSPLPQHAHSGPHQYADPAPAVRRGYSPSPAPPGYYAGPLAGATDPYASANAVSPSPRHGGSPVARDALWSGWPMLPPASAFILAD